MVPLFFICHIQNYLEYKIISGHHKIIKCVYCTISPVRTIVSAYSKILLFTTSVNPIRHLLERVNYMMGEVLTDVVKSNILEYADTMVRTGEIVQYIHFKIL